MDKKKAGIVASAVATCAVCASLIVGSTYALFTSNDKVNVAVTSAKLGVSATVDNVVEGWNKKTEGLTGANSELSATYDEQTKQLTVNKMLPGDVVTFDVNVYSVSTVSFNYRMSFGYEGDEKGKPLFDELLMSVTDKDTQTQADDESAIQEAVYYTSSVSEWLKGEASDDGSQILVATKTVALELPSYVDSTDIQGLTCNISFAVEAVQSNAVLNGESKAESVRAVRVYKNKDLDGAVASLNDGDVLILDGGESQWAGNVNITNADIKNFTVKGYNAGTLNFDTPNATIEYLNKVTKKVNAEDVAPDSLHIYGAVQEELTVKSGRVVVKSGASVPNALLNPAAGATAQIEVEKGSEVKVNVPETAKGTAVITVAEEAVVENLSINNSEGTVKLENSGKIEKVEIAEDVDMGNVDIENSGNGTIEIKVVDENSLIAALKAGGEVTLENDIVLTNQFVFADGSDTTLYLNGHRIDYAPASGVSLRPFWIEKGAKFTINGTEKGSGVYVDNENVYGVFDIWGELNVYGGRYETNGADNGAVVRGRVGSTTNIYGGEFVCTGYDAAIYDDGDSYIDGGYFYTNSSNRHYNNPFYKSKWNYCVRNNGGLMHIKDATVYGIQGGISAGGGETIIDNATVEVRDIFKTSESDNVSFYALYINGDHTKSSCTVNGGTFKAEYRFALFIGNPTPGDGGEQLYTMAEINGGTFISGYAGAGCAAVSDPNGNCYIPGGEYISHVKTLTQLKNALNAYETVSSKGEVTRYLATELPDYTVVLDADITATESFNLNGDLVLDLNGHTITSSAATVFEIGEVNVELKNGNIVATNGGVGINSAAASNISLKNLNVTTAGKGIVTNGLSLNIEGGKIDAGSYAVTASTAVVTYTDAPAYLVEVNINDAEIVATTVGIKFYAADATIENSLITVNAANDGSACLLAFRDTKLNVTDCELVNEKGQGVQGNGYDANSISADKLVSAGNNTDITLENCVITTSTGIYHPQVGGKLTVKDSTINATRTGVEMRASYGVFENVTITTTAEQFGIKANGSGVTTTGVALAVSQHSTDKEVGVNVIGGKYTGVYALYEEDVQNATGRELIEITLSETDAPAFVGGVYSQNCENVTEVPVED